MPRNDVYFELIVALGNPGAEYKNTRHNAGFIVADSFAESCNNISAEFKTNGASVRKFSLNDKDIFILKPLEFMNRSGQPVASFIAKKNIEPEKIIVVHDDMDIALGKIKLSFASGAAGHKGVESIITCIGSANFARIRIGIGKPNGTGADYVLSYFSDEEEKDFVKSVELSVEAIKFSLVNGINKAMNKFNGKNTADESAAHKNKTI